ncbi:MAG: SPOR domain-containing protein [Usitatibacter sp.]
MVFVPMLLDSEPRPSEPVLAIPSKEKAAPLPAPSPAAPAVTPAAPPVIATDSVIPAPDKDVRGQAASGTQAEPARPPPETRVLTPRAPPPPPAAPAPLPSIAAAPKLEGFAVQVGAFRDETKLKQAREKLVASKVPHYTERLESPGGALTRLRAGPFPTREAAESAQAVLKRSALDGKVIPLP